MGVLPPGPLKLTSWPPVTRLEEVLATTAFFSSTRTSLALLAGPSEHRLITGGLHGEISGSLAMPTAQPSIQRSTPAFCLTDRHSRVARWPDQRTPGGHPIGAGGGPSRRAALPAADGCGRRCADLAPALSSSGRRSVQSDLHPGCAAVEVPAARHMDVAVGVDASRDGASLPSGRAWSSLSWSEGLARAGRDGGQDLDEERPSRMRYVRPDRLCRVRRSGDSADESLTRHEAGHTKSQTEPPEHRTHSALPAHRGAGALRSHENRRGAHLNGDPHPTSISAGSRMSPQTTSVRFRG